MEILLADVMGICFGVRRAIEQAEAARARGGAVQTLGELVHNPQETARLMAESIRPVERAEEVTGETVVIRAHGARPEAPAVLRARGVRVIDATCPFVTNSQRIARDFAREGYTLVIVGHPEHPEVQGILGYVPPPAYVVRTADEVAALPADIRPGVLAQTTVDEATFGAVVAAIRARYPDARVRDTICSATRERQQAARALAAQVDVFYVVGGRHSSNTTRLWEVSAPLCPRTYRIETADEITAEQVAGAARVGVTAGASTPEWLIAAVVERLSELAGE